MAKAKNPVRSVEQTIRILEAIDELDGAGVTELAGHLGITKGTVHNHLSTLEEHEFLVRQDDTFHLGIRFFEFGETVRSKRLIYDIGVPEVDKLADETGELASVLVEEHGHGVYLYRAKGEEALTLDTCVGARVHLHNTGLGKTILAHLPEERVHEIIDQHGLPSTTENTITDRGELFEELETIRNQGYAYDVEERAEGICCVAAPVITKDGTVHGAVSISGPTSRMQGERLETEVPNLVTNAANVISINLTYS